MRIKNLSWSMRAMIGVLLISVGVMFAAATIVHIATFNPEKTLTLHADESKEAVFLYTAPGVISLVNDSPRVTLTASQSDSAIQWGYGASREVEQYLGKSAALEIKGLANNGTSADVFVHTADKQSADLDKKTRDTGGFSLDSSDLWLASGQGKGEVTFTLPKDQGVDRSLIATTSAGTAPEITLTWIYDEKIASPAPLIVVGILLALIGVVLLLIDRRDRIDRYEAAQKAARAKAEKEFTLSAETSVLPIFKGDLSDPQTGRSVQREYTAASFGAAILPGTPRTEALRNRELMHSDWAMRTSASEEGIFEQDAYDCADSASTPHVTLWECTQPFENDGDIDEGAVDLWKEDRDA